jgi:hypothetical protein
MSTRKQTTASAIKKALKKAFPEIKFSCTQRDYSACYIRYEDGPKFDDVKKITSKYQAGHFDGMTDSYEYGENEENLNQCQYVFLTRDYSEEKESALKMQLKEYYGAEYWQGMPDYEQARILRGELVKIDLSTMPNLQEAKAQEKREEEERIFEQEQKREQENKEAAFLEECKIEKLKQRGATAEQIEQHKTGKITTAEAKKILYPFLITGKFPALNKNNNLKENAEQIKEKSFLRKCVIVHEINFSSSIDWEIFTNNFLTSQDFYPDNLGRSILPNSDPRADEFAAIHNEEDATEEQLQYFRENSALLCSMASYKGESIIIDTSGHNYARYVAEPIKEI